MRLPIDFLLRGLRLVHRDPFLGGETGEGTLLSPYQSTDLRIGPFKRLVN